MIKKIALIAVLMAGVAAPAMAQMSPPRGGPAAMLESLDLSDAQWLQVRKLTRQHREASRPLHQRQRQLHESLAQLDPAAPDYPQRLQQAQDQAAQLARDRVQDFVSFKQQIDAVLTPEQRAKLAAEKTRRRHRPEAPAGD